MRLIHSLLVLALSLPCTAGAQQTAATVRRATPADGFFADSTRFTVGKRVYLRSSRTYIGTIVDTAEKHDFRAGHFPRPWMKAVLIARRDGPREWVPVERITRIYLVR